MNVKESRRAQELRETLAARFDLPEDTVRDALLAVAEAIHERLPRGVRVAFLSWMPECRSLLLENAPTATDAPPRGSEALKMRVAAAGVPEDAALMFIVEIVRFLGERCGRPLADALRRKIPEIAAIEQGAGALQPSS